MRRFVLLLGLIMCCGVGATSGQHHYGGDPVPAEDATTWQPNRFLEPAPEKNATWHPNRFLKPKPQVNPAPADPPSDDSRPAYNGSGPRYATGSAVVSQSAIRAPDGGTAVRNSASAAVPVPAPKTTRTAGLDPRPASVPVWRNARPAGLNLLKSRPGRHYPWKLGIVTTIFWVGERSTPRNPVPNQRSAWDKHWYFSYGGYDNPDPWARRHYVPVSFTPRENPFYFALPYNDVEGHHTKREAAWVIPWFRETFVHDGQTVLKDRWIAIRHGNRLCYAQWEDCGPFRTDHWQYVFGPERPRPNLNQGAGLDVSPAVRDYLGLANKDVCDWKFVEFAEVPLGPWKFYGRNRPFALAAR